MGKYTEFKNKQQATYDAFPQFYAFNQKQFAEGMAKFGLTPDDKDKIVSTGYGGFILKADAEKFTDMVAKLADEHQEAMKDEQFAYEMFRYELANHEYCITYDLTDTLDACSLTLEEVNKNPMLLGALKRARRDYLANSQNE